MARPHGGKVADVKRDDGWRADALGERDHRGVGSAEREVRVLGDELRHAREVFAEENVLAKPSHRT